MDREDRVAYDDFQLNLRSLPIAFALAFAIKWIGFLDGILWYFFTIPLHEMGHTVMAWLGSRFALPLGALIPMAGVTFIFPGRNILVYLAFSLGLLWFIRASWEERRWASLIGGFAALVLLNYCTWIVPEQRMELAITYFGIGGEFALGALLVLSFYYPMPDRLRWDFFRFIALFVGAYGLVSVSKQWLDYSAHLEKIPWGSFLNGSGDSGGDLARLRSDFGWPPREIVNSYLRLGKICVGLIVGHYAYFLYDARKSS